MKFLVVIMVIFYSLSNSPKTFDLEVTIMNINTLHGNIQIGLYNDAKSFPKSNKAYKTCCYAVTNDTMIFTFTHLERGEYAVALYHDINSDKKCNLNFFGRPIEPYGFSNNYKPRLFKPSFKNCKFIVDKNTAISIKLID